MGISDDIEIATIAQVDKATTIKIKATIALYSDQVYFYNVSRAIKAKEFATKVLQTQSFCFPY